MRINETRNVARLLQGMGGTDDYTELINKPKINGVELNGDKSLKQIGISTPKLLSSETMALILNEQGGDIVNDDDADVLEDILWATGEGIAIEPTIEGYDADDALHIIQIRYVSNGEIHASLFETLFRFEKNGDDWIVAIES